MKRNEPFVSIMGIDPGLNALGASIGWYYPRVKKLVIRDHTVVSSNTLAKKDHRDEVKEYGSLISLFTCEEAMENLLASWSPEFIVSEDAFYNPRMPNAFLSLKLCINAIQRVLFRHEKALYLIAPTIIKRTIFGSGTANKAAVHAGIVNHDDILFKDSKKKQMSKLVEHEADSIAVCYTFTQLYLPDILLLKNT